MRIGRRSGVSTVVGTILFILVAVLFFVAYAAINVSSNNFQGALLQASLLNNQKQNEVVVTGLHDVNSNATSNDLMFNLTNTGGQTANLLQTIYVYHDASGALRQYVTTFTGGAGGHTCGSILAPGGTCVYDSTPVCLPGATPSAGSSCPAGTGPLTMTDDFQRPSVGVVSYLGNTVWFNYTSLSQTTFPSPPVSPGALAFAVDMRTWRFMCDGAQCAQGSGYYAGYPAASIPGGKVVNIQVVVQNVDPLKRTANLSATSSFSLRCSGCGKADIYIAGSTTINGSWYATRPGGYSQGLIPRADDSYVSNVPYEPISIPYGGYAALNFAFNAPCVAPAVCTLAGPLTAPSPPVAGDVTLYLTGMFSDGSPFAQQATGASMIVQDGAIAITTACGGAVPCYDATKDYFMAQGVTYTLSLAGFGTYTGSLTPNIHAYLVSPIFTGDRVTLYTPPMPVATTCSSWTSCTVTIPSSPLFSGYYALELSDGVVEAYATAYVGQDFGMSASPTSLTVTAGGSAKTSTITLSAIGPFSGNVLVSVAPVAGLTLNAAPGTVAVPGGGTGTSTLTVSAASSTAAGTYPVTVTGTSGGVTHTATVTVHVVKLGLDPNGASSRTLKAGGSTSYNGISGANSIKTDNENDVIYACATTKNTGLTLGISDSAGLTWTQRASSTASAPEQVCWYAVATTALAGDAITFTASANSGGWVVEVFAVSGTDTTSASTIFDGSAVKATGTGTAPSASFTTTKANDFLVGIGATMANNNLGVGSGFTQIEPPQNQNQPSALDEWRAAAAAGTYAVPFTSANSGAWVVIAEAFALG